ncbi:MAG: DUF58 domain-containing protein [Trueperaceae bacterium]
MAIAVRAPQVVHSGARETLISARSRNLLDRYSLAARFLSRESGERTAKEAGQSVEFHDFRSYQPGDELRYVDWNAYARTGRLYTRLHQAERTIRLHLLLDVSRSMRVGGKGAYAERLAQLLAYVGQRDARSQVHLSDGKHGRPVRGLRNIGESWDLIESASALKEGPLPTVAIRDFALNGPSEPGAALVLVLSDLLEEGPLRPALTALRARGLDASFLQVMAAEDLEPEAGRLELIDSESGEKLEVTVSEARAYRRAVRDFVARRRSEILEAGFRHVLLRVPEASGEELEREAFAALLRAGILEKR